MGTQAAAIKSNKNPGLEKKDFLYKIKKISAIVPIYNIEDDIKSVYSNLVAFLKNSNYSFELIFVDDGSLDSTYKKVSELSKENPFISIIKMRSQFGEASAFTAGLKQSTGDVILYFTARVNVNLENLSALITKLEQGNDLIVGWRYPRKDSRLNQIISKLFNSITRKLSKVKLHDINSGVFVTKREVLDNINVYGDLHNFIPVLAERQGYKIDEAKIEQLPGKFRKSKYFREYLQRLLDIITVIFLTNYSKKPIHFLGFVGALFTLTGAVIEIYLFVYRILLLGPIAGRPLLLLGALLLVIGIQLISIGLLGEMIIFTHARDIKEYNIEEIIESDQKE
jgi:glycosyltransferase involved in cell wall biosynthesis